MTKCIVSLIISVAITGVLSVFVVFFYVESSISNESKELAEKVKDLEVRLKSSNDNLSKLKVEMDKLSKRNDELEDIGKERVLNIMSMYK